MSNTLAIIGGTGLTQLEGLTILQAHDVYTPYGRPSAPVLEGVIEGMRVLFLARHGHPHTIPPHKVNYRANIWALQSLNATDIIGINACGAITKSVLDAQLVVPDQILDYTWGREHTFFDGTGDAVQHVDMSNPYSASLRELLIDGAQSSDIDIVKQAVYGVTQGPRLETVAEITRMELDGCDLVGMTGMLEAALARELKMQYASLCVLVNPAAGKGHKVITLKDINEAVANGMVNVLAVLKKSLEAYHY